MTDPTKETVWITIPDEGTPVLDACTAELRSANTTKRVSADKVKNRAFWGSGFVVLVAFVGLLLAPQQVADLLQGNLFDGGFQVVPDYEEQQTGALFGEDEAEGDAETEAAPVDESVVVPESDAVSIQVEPITDVTEEDDSTSDSEETAEDSDASDAETDVVETTDETDGSDTTGDKAMMETDAEPVEVDLGTGEVAVPTEGDTNTTADDEDALSDSDLLQSLSKQLNDFKEKERQNTQTIQELMQMLEDQAAGLHGSAGAQPGAGNTASQTGTQTAAQLGVGGFGSGGAGSAGIGSGTYRYNTHTVTVSPYDILAQNKAATTLPASYQQANVTYTGVQAYSQQNYNPVLAGVQGQPDTGPAETLLFAFVLASLGVLVWGSFRAIKA